MRVAHHCRDKLETETGLSTHRGMILRHALKLFLEAKGM